MIDERFSPHAIARALGNPAVTAVTVVETFVTGTTEVAQLDVRFSDGQPPRRMFGRSATGAGIPAARRELEFHTDIAPLWNSRAATLLGALDDHIGDVPHVLLLTEDLGATGHTLVGADISEAQLDGVLDALVALHARFWDAIPPAYLDPARALPSVTQSAQAWPPSLIARNAAAVHAAATELRATQLAALTPSERALLDDSLATWERQLTARVASGRAITLIHADFHFYGNVLFAGADPRPRIIDWSELKPGLGPHDLAYCLVGAPTPDRPTRDLAVLHRYWSRLTATGVASYSWDLCRWDHHFSLVTNLLQAVLQQSAMWFSRSAAIIDALACRSVLHEPPPI